MAARIALLLLVAALAAGSFMGYRLLRTSIAAEVYRERLAELSDDYTSLRKQYNEAVSRTAVTELVVRDGQLLVSVRTAEGELRTIRTPFDPANEIYVDYVVWNGRLWIRRVFDDETPPDDGVVIDPALADVAWESDEAAYGKAAYRRLEDGRWLVSVTGDGSLGLARVAGDAQTILSPPPPVRSYAPIEEEVDAALGRVRPDEAIRAFVRQLSAPS